MHKCHMEESGPYPFDMSSDTDSLTASDTRHPEMTCATKAVVNSMVSLQLAVPPEQLDLTRSTLMFRGLNACGSRDAGLRRRAAGTSSGWPLVTCVVSVPWRIGRTLPRTLP
jgi:hypothetical protein